MAYARRVGPGKYELQVSLGKGSDGKYIKKTKTYYCKESTPKKQEIEAMTAAEEWERKLKGGFDPEAERITFRQVAEKYLAAEEAKLGREQSDITTHKKTLDAYKAALEAWAYPVIGAVPIVKVRKAHLQEIQDKILAPYEDGGEIKTRKSPTAYNLMTPIRNTFRYALEMELISSSPFTGFKMPSGKRLAEPRALELRESVCFLGALDLPLPVWHGGGKRKKGYWQTVQAPQLWSIYYKIALWTGARRGELIGLKWGDVDWKTGEINISRAIEAISGQPEKDPKGRRARSFKLQKSAVEVLRVWYESTRYRAEQKDWRGQSLKNFSEQWVFYSGADPMKHIGLDAASKQYKKIIRRYNAGRAHLIESGEWPKDTEWVPIPEDTTAHGLRHTAVTFLVAAGVDLATISSRIGHYSPAFTLSVYTHALSKLDETAAATLEEIIPAPELEYESDDDGHTYIVNASAAELAEKESIDIPRVADPDELAADSYNFLAQASEQDVADVKECVEKLRGRGVDPAVIVAIFDAIIGGKL